MLELGPFGQVFLVTASIIAVASVIFLAAALVFHRERKAAERCSARMWNLHMDLLDQLAANSNLDAYRMRRVMEERKKRAGAIEKAKQGAQETQKRSNPNESGAA